MPSLAQLLTSHDSLLVLDAASTRVQVGLLRTGGAPLWQNLADEASTGIFAGTAAALKEAGTKLDTIGAFVFCEGPGSTLGIRTIAMAVRTWQILRSRPAYAYQSLAVAGRFAWMQSRRDLAVVADARRETWHVQLVGTDGSLPPLQRVVAAALPLGELLTPENFRAWGTPPRPATVCSYDLAQIFSALADADLIRAVVSPDAFQHEAPEYKKWSAQVHSAANATK